MSSWRSALTALILVLPAALLMVSVVLNVGAVHEALTTVFITNGNELNTLGHFFVYGGLFALPLAFLIALSPLLRKSTDGTRHLPWLSVLVALLALALMFPAFYELGKDFYNCEVLQIPNCD